MPCFNEEMNINEIYSQLVDTKLLNNDYYEFIFVNNGSTDKTEHNLNKLLNNYFNVKIISIDKNIGYGNGMKRGIEETSNEIVYNSC